MRPWHELMMDAVKEERERLATRRGMLRGGARLAAGATLALAAGPALTRMRAAAQAFEDDVDVLNYALTLEHLENAFYRGNAPQFAAGTDPFGNDLATYLTQIGQHEADHVATLTQVIESLGGTPVTEQTYNFGVTDTATFLATAQALENTGVSAYDGAGQFLTSPDLLTAAGTIVAVEARHAAYFNILNAVSPFPDSFDEPQTPDQVLAFASQFIVGPGGAATPAS